MNMDMRKASTDLEQARNKQQMGKYIKSLDYSLRRLLILQETVNELVEEKKHQLAQQENIQTYKTKIINLSRIKPFLRRSFSHHGRV